MTSLLRVLCAAALATCSSQVGAQDLFGNPFASAEALRTQRGALPSATLRLRYESSGDAKAGQAAGEVVIDVAPDWGYVKRADRQTLYDFRLGRMLQLRDEGFASLNIISHVVFRVLERQNRAALAHGLRAGRLAPPDLFDACDAETELGVVVPGLKEPAATDVKQSGVTTTLECNGRVVGILEGVPGDGAPLAARIRNDFPAFFLAK